MIPSCGSPLDALEQKIAKDRKGVSPSEFLLCFLRLFAAGPPSRSFAASVRAPSHCPRRYRRPPIRAKSRLPRRSWTIRGRKPTQALLRGTFSPTGLDHDRHSGSRCGWRTLPPLTSETRRDVWPASVPPRWASRPETSTAVVDCVESSPSVKAAVAENGNDPLPAGPGPDWEETPHGVRRRRRNVS